MRLKALAAVTIAVTAAGATLVAVPTSVGAATPVECIAHRGGTWAGHTEETVPNYQKAIDAGAPEVEGDVHFSRTGYPYMLHDADMGMFGHPDVDLADISGTTATSYTNPATGEHIASLWDVRGLMLDNPTLRLQVEMKDHSMTSANWDMIDSRLSAVRDRVTVTSFDVPTLRQAQDRGYRTELNVSADTSTTVAPAQDEEFSAVSAAHVAALTGVGVTLQAYTPDTAADWTALAAEGVTAMVTDYPASCLAWESTRTGGKRR